MDKPAKKISISLGNLRGLKMDNRYLFAAILLLIFLMEIFVIKDAVGVILSLENQTTPQGYSSKGVRVNFSDYNTAVKHIDNAATFKPSGGLSKNPFGVPGQ